MLYDKTINDTFKGDSMSLSKHLKSIKMFETLTDQELKSIEQICKTRRVVRQTHLFYEQETLTHFYFILSGDVKIYRVDQEGREQIINYFGTHEMFPHHALFRTGQYPANAITVSDTEFITIEKGEFEEMLIAQPEVMIKMVRYLGDLIVDLQKRLQQKVLSSTTQQILHLLRRLCKSHGSAIDHDRTLIRLKLTKQDLANMLGLTRETVSRNVSHFKAEGIVEEDQDGYIVINQSKIKW